MADHAAGMSPQEAQALYDASVVRRQSGDLEGARAGFAAIIDAVGSDRAAAGESYLAMAHVHLSDVDLLQDDEAGAAAHAEAAWELAGMLPETAEPSPGYVAQHAGARLASCRLAEGKDAQALDVLRGTLERSGAAPEELELALIPTARLVALRLSESGIQATAQRLVDQLVEFSRQLSALARSEALTVRGDFLAGAGAEADALHEYQAALDACPPGSDENDLRRAEVLTISGQLADRLGLYASAAVSYDRALRIRERLLPEDDVARLSARYNVAELSRHLDSNLDRAGTELAAVVSALRSKPEADRELFALALKNLAQARLAQQQLQAAGELVAECLTLKLTTLDFRAQVLVLQAQVQRGQGLVPDVAELRSMADLVRDTEGADSSRYLQLQAFITPLLPLDQAEDSIRTYTSIVDSLAEPTTGSERNLLVDTLLNLAMTQWYVGRFADALATLGDASWHHDLMTAEAWRVGSALATEGKGRDPLASLVVELVLKHLGHDDAARRLAFRLGGASKKMQAEVLRRQRELVLEGHYDLFDVHALASRLRIAEAASESPGDSAVTSDPDEVLAQRLSPAALLDAIDASDADEVASHLPPGSVLVEYVLCRAFSFDPGPDVALGRETDWYVAFVLPAGHPDDLFMVDLGDAQAIDRAVGTLLETIAAQAPPTEAPTDWRAAARAMARLIWDPIAPQVDLDADLIVATDGKLGLVPFDSLLTANDLPLLAQTSITCVGTGRDARLFGVRPNWGDTVPVVVGNVEYGEPWAPFVPLPGTQAESNRVAALLETQPVQGDAASRETLLNVGDPEILHLATHGYYLPAEEPAAALGASLTALLRRSALVSTGIALADANKRVAGTTNGFAGVLTALDVLGLDLYGTDLTVLSACESGIGPEDDREGLVSLARSFVLAGSRSVVWTLWRVDDWVTADLMVGFYRRLLRATPRSVALYRGKRTVYARNPERPDLWAGFVLQGDGGALLRFRTDQLAPDQVVQGSVSPGEVDDGTRIVFMGNAPDVSIAIAESSYDRAQRAYAQGRYRAATKRFQDVLDVVGTAPARFGTLGARAHTGLARALARRDLLTEALAHATAAVAAYDELEDWPMPLGSALDDLAGIEADLGMTDDARTHYARALSVKREERPGGHPSIDLTRARLAELDQGRSPSAQ